jgi:mRNA-degrading endonuclease toxin of MazEF toxin-antitoxin module
LIAVDRSYLAEPMGMLSAQLMAAVDRGLRMILGL